MTTVKKLIQEVKDGMEKSLIISPEDKSYWLPRLDDLPVPVLENILRMVKSKNDIIDGYISDALSGDTDGKYMAGLKAKVREIKQKAFNLQEKSENKAEEKKMEKMLKNI